MPSIDKKYYHNLDLDSNEIKAGRIYNLTTTQRNALSLLTTDKGYLVYDTTLLSLFVWDGTAWTSAGGGSQDLEQTLVIGNQTGGTNILINNADAIELENTSLLKKGTYDFGGTGGISRICSVGYEDMWQSGIRHVFDNNGLIRHSTNCFNIIPDNTFDNTLRFKVGSLWTLDNGDTYECTDVTTATAIWVLRNNSVPTLQQVTTTGNTTTNNIVLDSTTGEYPYNAIGQNIITDSSISINYSSATYPFDYTTYLNGYGGLSLTSNVNGTSSSTDINAGGIFMIASDSFNTSEINLSALDPIDGSPYLELYNTSSKNGILKVTNLTNNNVVLQFPNKGTGDYTIATIDDIPTNTSVGFEQNFLLMGA